MNHISTVDNNISYKEGRRTIASPGRLSSATRQSATKRQVARYTVKIASDKASKLNNTTVFHKANFIAQSDFFFSHVGSRL